MSFAFACPVDEVVAGKPHAVTVDGVDVALVRDGDDFYAIHDECSHANIPLSEGDLDGCLIECWLHGSTFDLRTVIAHPRQAKCGKVYSPACALQTTRAVVEVLAIRRRGPSGYGDPQK